MNIFTRIARTAATAFILSMALAGVAVGSDPVPPSQSLPDTDWANREASFRDDPSAKEIALSGAALLLKNTGIVKKVDGYRQRLVRRTRFEYGTTITPEVEQSGRAGPRPPDSGKEPVRTIRFAGGLDDSLLPILEFDSRLKTFDFSSTFHLLDHELECDISSPSINRLVGGHTGLNLRSDGSQSEAAIQIKFPF